MKYIQVTFSFTNIQEYQQDLLISDLADIGYNTFEDTDLGFAAFVDIDTYDASALHTVLAQFEGEIEYQYEVLEIEGKNWNEEWEKNFEPLIIDDLCYVRATFHEAQPKYPYEIVIDPKMAFGTGHHQTTTMMMQYILSADVAGKEILDMGCGTGILAILAAKRGAARLVAIDYDEVCYLSTLENTALNGVTNLEAIWGGKEVIPKEKYDVILANINRNILLDQIPVYDTVLKPGGFIYFSGFYESPDLELIKQACEPFGIHYVDHKKIGDWVAACFKK
ncbi:50S ribosomal protein L11 methyltransferase [Pedobacter sp. MC2016-24]|uniref:50S ribosomal protein L11 methyltransferase n=1 Tax=Pedobacter sp. MC2016-24 TaxID=2780090 RepID=UPI001881A009|nr:50S ribosomal protein L11 methyltransferase [Pedobacter sp. MC2016-24]MBE9600072.1 50S ribosomal protein L11 methyltransferase [Pedobacter sp. MC2016-24]